MILFENVQYVENRLENEGWAVAREAVSAEGVASMHDWINERRAQAAGKPELEAQFEKDAAPGSGAMAVRKMRRLFWDDPEFWRPLLEREGIFDWARRLVGPKPALVFHAAFLKPAEIGGPVVYHQDQALWNRDYPGAMNMWLALAPSDEENGCLRFCSGSHLRGHVEHRMLDSDDFHVGIEPGELGYQPDPAVMAPGDLAIWGRYMIHGSLANKSPRGRDSIVMVFVDSTTPDFGSIDQFLVPEAA